MSEQYPGGYIVKNPPTPDGPYYNSLAPGIWTLSQAAAYKSQGLWPTPGVNPPVYWIGLFSPPAAYTSITGEYRRSGAFDSSGNLYTALQLGPQAGPYLAGDCAVKVTPNGVLSWATQLATSGESTNFYGPVLDSSSNIYYTGLTDGNNTFLLLTKYSPSGVLQWSNKSSTYMNGIFVGGIDSSNNLYSMGSGGSSNGAWVKYNTSGTVSSAILIVDGARGYVFPAEGFTTSSGVTHMGFTTLYEGGYAQLNSSGGVTVYTTLGNSGYGGNLIGFQVDSRSSPSNFYATAYAQGAVTWSLWKVSTSNGTTVQWSKSSSGLSPYYGAIDVDTSGNVYIFCQDVSNTSRTVILKFNSSGTLQWQRYLDYSAAATPYAISIDSTNAVMWLTIQLGGSPNSVAIARLPTDGTQTGTYGSWVYGTPSYTFSTPSGSWVSGSYSTSAYGGSFSSYSGTSSSQSITVARQNIA